MNKQDRGRVRSAEELERKYNFSGMQKAIEMNEMGLNKTNREMEQFVNSTLGSIENMQSQIDGKINTYYYDGVPTLSTPPASEWAEIEYAEHEGDQYYDRKTGYAYRFAYNSVSEVYEWKIIEDNAVVEALAVANAARDTADSKRRVFIVTPYPPYDNGDLWLKELKELYVCQIGKPKGEIYEESDFTVATKYTDDSLAEKVGGELKVVDGKVTILNQFKAAAENGSETVIHGGAIKTKSIKSESIDTEEVFSQYIEAIKLLIKGESAFEDKIVVRYKTAEGEKSNASMGIEERNIEFFWYSPHEGGGTTSFNPGSSSILVPCFVIDTEYGLCVNNAMQAKSMHIEDSIDGDTIDIKSEGRIRDLYAYNFYAYGPAEMKRDLVVKGNLDVSGKLNNVYPVGSVITMATNTNPATFLGGTWELFDKGFKRTVFNSNELEGMFILGTNATSADVRVIIDGHNVDIRCRGTYSVDLTDTDRTLCSLNYDKVGFKNLPFDAYGVGGGDNANAMVFGYLGYESGNVVIADINPKTDGVTIASGELVTINFSSNITMSNMYDSFCDKFYFKRIS